jgi:anaerobic magnesium-protoporphyrin IX monomethyl ester cyclase
MRVALINPNWSFEGSIYFGCREPHLPIEFGCARALLEAAGHETEIIDGQLCDLSEAEIQRQVEDVDPEMIVVTTAPTYLFWRCPPPELRVPRRLLDLLSTSRTNKTPIKVVVGPHASTTPRTTLRKLPAEVVVLGECEEVLVMLAERDRSDWSHIPSLGFIDDEEVRITGTPYAVDLDKIPALRWPKALLERHMHHHHRFDSPAEGIGAEVEATRGCPYHCTFCNKEDFRNGYRKRPLPIVLEEIDQLLAAGVRYIYFIDEIFLPDRALLEALCEREVVFGVQMRIDNWNHQMLDLLGRAGCKSIEAGMESISPKGRSLLAKRCKLSTEELTGLLMYARERVPFVQANLLESGFDEPDEVEAWRARLAASGVWANKPVPMFPYPGTPDYVQRWGRPDDQAWERAHAHYLQSFGEFSDIQETRPLPLGELERGFTGEEPGADD